MEPFYGTINLAHWIRNKSGMQYNCITGLIEIKEAADIWGFKVGRSESSWMAVVSGETEIAYVPGSEIYAVLKHSKDNVVNHDALVLG